MLETGVVITQEGPVYWHLPRGRTAGGLPDSQALWEVFWNLRKEDGLGFAHSHPGSGIPSPSWIDLTTFAAIEMGLGRRLQWWITSSDCVILLRFQGPGRYDYGAVIQIEDIPWIEELRQHSVYSQV